MKKISCVEIFLLATDTKISYDKFFRFSCTLAFLFFTILFCLSFNSQHYIINFVTGQLSSPDHDEPPLTSGHNMSLNKTFAFLILTFLLRTSNALDDLLEQYVKHVGLVNSVKYEHDQHHSKYQRRVRGDSGSIFNFGANRKLNNYVNVRDRRDVSDAVDDMNQWTHWEYLDEDRKILLRWQTRHQEILFRLEANTLGYVGIGFSPNGGMEGADIIIGWVDDEGKPTLLVSQIR